MDTKANNGCSLPLSGALAQTWSPPSAAIHWDGLNHIRVYAVDPSGQVREWQWDGNGWTGPSYIGATAMPGTSVTATNSGSHVSVDTRNISQFSLSLTILSSKLRVYYKKPNGYAAERVYENGWTDGAVLP